MEDFKEQISKLPQNPGVYKFLDKNGVVLYVGKATNLRSRVRQYFSGHDTRATVDLLVPLIADIETIETDSVLEALILEANLIKKFLPKFNMMGKDDKSFAYFAITKDDYPRILIVRETDLHSLFHKWSEVKVQKHLFGPYLSKYQMEIALKIMRRIFPIHQRSQKTEKGCLDFQIGLCSGPYSGAISKEDYKKNIRNIRYILEGKKKTLLRTLEKEMKEAAKKHEYEKAGEIRSKVFALQHIRDIALITRRDENYQLPITNFQNNESGIGNCNLDIGNCRIEGYDISNISGQHSVGSMVVFDAHGPVKSQYRKFKIKTIEGADDVNSMKEILTRRFNNDWPLPNLIVLDGGQGHLNMAQSLFQELGLEIPLMAISKGPTRKNFEFRIQNFESKSEFKNEMLKRKNLLLQLMEEAHRFAITYHRKVRRKSMKL